MTTATLELSQALIRKESITPKDEGCLELIAARLKAIGFATQLVHIEDVTNLWAIRRSQHNDAKLFCFAGHTDVVPPGPLDQWDHPPFAAVVENGQLYGRGAADMKGGVAAMIVATEDYFSEHSQHQHDIAFLLTSDEEGIAQHGTKAMMEWLNKQEIQIDYCVIGEPSSSETVGDVIRIGRRGSLTGYLSINGIQGHVAYPDKALNAINQSLDALKALTSIDWDQGTEHFPATSFQIAQVHAGEADNVIPGTLKAHFNLRYNDSHTAETIQTKIQSTLNQFDIDYQLTWHHSGVPFLTKPDAHLIQTTQETIKDIQNIVVELSTGGGTSDGRFIAPTGCEVVELGLCNASIHKVNESTPIDDLETLKNLYLAILEKI